MRKLLIGLFVILALLIGAIAIVPSLVPSSVYKEKIQTQLSKELGRNVAIDGDVKIAVFPSIRAKTDRVVISNPPEFDGDVFASMDGLNARVKLLPLLSKRVEISAFTLKRPVINLEKTADGRSNWVLGAQTEQPAQTPESGPFKRDGRYSEIDPAIGLFAIEDGEITYKDAANGTSYELKEANLKFSLPSLAKKVKIDGDVILNGEPITLKMALDTPRKFLNGEAAPLDFDLKTNFAKLSASGQFLASEDIAFDLNIDGKLSDIAALAAYLPTDLPLAKLAKTADITGQYSFDGQIFSAKNASIGASGDLMNLSYKGDATMAENPVLDGSVKLDVSDIPLLAGLLGQQIKGINLLKTLALTADLSAESSGFAASNISAKVSGQDLNAAFTGTGSYGDVVTAKGRFDADTASIAALIKALDMDIPQAKALGSGSLSGDLNMNGDKISLTTLVVDTKGGVAEGGYNGTVTLGKTPSVDGQFETSISSLAQFQTASGTSIPYADAIGAITAKGRVSGSMKALTLSDLDAALSGGKLNGQFKGSANVADGFDLKGELSADVPSLRALAASTGTQLPPSTPAGSIYEAASISGTISGNPKNITFADAKIAVDHLKGTGRLSIDMAQSKPFIVGKIDMEGLDLRPYMASYAAQNPTGEIVPWSEDPLNLAMLNSVNGDFKLNTPSITTDRMVMGAANVDAKLRDGVLTANVPKLNMYGGLGNLNAVLDTSKTEPRIVLDMKMNELQSNTFLSAIAGFTNATGKGSTGVHIEGQGSTQSQIMKSLTGNGNFNVKDGQISGVDLQQFLTGLDTALKTRSLPSGIGSNYATKFNDIAGLFTIENGVAKIGKFNLDGFGVAAQGAGQIDLGGQNIDFSLRPRLTGKSASDLASFGIPLRLKGEFGSVSAGLDTELLGQIAAAKAKAQLQKELTDKVGGPVGGILGGILGGSQPAATPPQPENGENAQPTQPKTEEAITNILGGLFGNKSKKEETPKEKQD